MLSILFLIFIFIKNLLIDKCQDKLSMFHATRGKKSIYKVYKDFILMASNRQKARLNTIQKIFILSLV